MRISSDKWTGKEAVSYTHLDVYKRQPQSCFERKDVSGGYSRNVYTNGNVINSWCTFLKNAVCCGSISGVFQKGRDER